MASGAELSQRHYPWQITTLPLWSGYGALGGALENVAAPCPFSAQRGIAWGDSRGTQWQILGLIHSRGIQIPPLLLVVGVDVGGASRDE